MATVKTGSKKSSSTSAKRSSKNSSSAKGKAGSRPSGRAWKLERASVKRAGADRPKSNKYSAGGDSDVKPQPGERTRAWVGGYTRADGKKVKGHYREISQGGTR